MRCVHERSGWPVVAFLALCLLCLTEGCSSFSHAWAKAAVQTASTNSVLGRWAGTWSSDANGHHGELRCIVSARKDGTYNARFHAVYRKVLGFGYTALLKGVETNSAFEFSGQANLGWWAGGVYHYEGRVEGTNFFSTYRCKYDHGTFEMTRPMQESPVAVK